MQNHQLLLAAGGALALLAFAAPADGQGFTALHPYSQSGDFYVADTTNDNIYRLQDLNLDGDCNDAFEVSTFYDDTLGPYPLSNNTGVAVGPDGVVYVTDSSQDFVLRMLDLNGDGDCNDTVGAIDECTIYFDGSLVTWVMDSSANLNVDAAGRLFIAVANASTGNDIIIVLEDKNGDGDANDGANEAWVYYDITVVAGAALPQDVVIGKDGHLYYVEIDPSGNLAKGVYRLDDANISGDIDVPSESVPFFIPPALPNNPFFWGLTIDGNGYYYMADTLNELIWRFRDENGDNDAQDAGEYVQYWTAAGSSLIWKVDADAQGRLLCAESQAPDRVLLMEDKDGNGVIQNTVSDPDEYQEIYSDLLSPVVIGNPRSIAWARRPTLLSSSPTPQIGTNLSYITYATTGDFVLGLWSAGPSGLGAPVPLPPYGPFELTFVPIGGFLYFGVVPPGGLQASSGLVPNNPGLVGQTLHVQGIVGNAARAETSNAVTVTFAP